MTLFLVGFMGAGKTTVGVLLAEALGVGFVDLDAEIEARNGASVIELFERLGESGFRDLESGALAGCLDAGDAVVATGGGVPLAAANRDLMRKSGTVLWLDVPADQIVARLGRADRSRPLYRDPESAARLHAAREPVYRRAADLRIDAASGSPAEVAARILDALGVERCAI